ncbi:hypothetical protein B0H67DRAFT_666774 [Lasiosphaeris hirsuta]|uniref:Tachykinin family protein n=1 Tax=Lasiosphaeris hirsuta TaxID=260670 RepID=A0AA40DTW7_9PEZI|nr:hypothetical protein B0H67DRAFT_666774 [Lasiosphaeris hirsuta]
MSKYEFFSAEGPEGKFLASNKAIRSQAMKTALRTRTRQTDGNPEIVTSLADSEEVVRRKGELNGRFRLPGRARGIKKTTGHGQQVADGGSNTNSLPSGGHTSQARAWPQVQAVQRFGNGLADPFQTLPIPNKGRVDSLVKYTLTRFNLNLSTVDARRPWFGYAMQSAAVMHATLALSAGFWAASMATPDPALEREGFRQQGEAMAMVRTHLGTQSVTNTVLATMACLGNAFQGRFEAAAVHLGGVGAIVEARGGVGTILDDFYLCRCIDWVDVQTATGLGRVPLFPPLHGGMDDVFLPPVVLQQVTLPSLPPSLCPTVRAIFLLLRQATRAQECLVVSSNSLRILMHLADSRILHHLYGVGSSRHDYQDQQEAHACPDTSLVLAAHVFLHGALRQVPSTSHLLRTLVGRLQDALSKEVASQTGIATNADNCLSLAWAAFVGLAATSEAVEGERHAWFTNLLGAAIGTFRDSDTTWPLADDNAVARAEIQSVLETFLWRDEFCLPGLHVGGGRGEVRGN